MSCRNKNLPLASKHQVDSVVVDPKDNNEDEQQQQGPSASRSSSVAGRRRRIVGGRDVIEASRSIENLAGLVFGMG
mgnify:CR=1 FL=1